MFYLFTRVDYSCVVSPTQFFSYRWVGNTKLLSEHVHNNLPWLDHFFFTGLFVDAFFRYIVILCDTADHLVYRNPFVRLYIMFYKGAHIRERHSLPFHLGLANNHIQHTLQFADVPTNTFSNVLNNIVRNTEAVLLDFSLNYSRS